MHVDHARPCNSGGRQTRQPNERIDLDSCACNVCVQRVRATCACNVCVQRVRATSRGNCHPVYARTTLKLRWSSGVKCGIMKNMCKKKSTGAYFFQHIPQEAERFNVSSM